MRRMAAVVRERAWRAAWHRVSAMNWALQDFSRWVRERHLHARACLEDIEDERFFGEVDCG